MKQEVKAEPHPQDHPSCSNKDLVTITITLNPVAAQVNASPRLCGLIGSPSPLVTSHCLQNVPSVMTTMAGLLRVPGPIGYQLSRAPGSEQSALALLAGVRVPLVQVCIS